MDHELLKKAAIYYNEAGFATLPINCQKRPTVKSWAEFQTVRPTLEQINRWFDGSLPETTGLAVITGKISGSVEVVDVDCKYDLTGNLMKDFCDILKEHLAETFGKLAIARTVSGGYHIAYRIPVDLLQGNKKLASRPATAAETAQGKKLRDLIETRGEGGYIAVAPTNGYKWLQNTPKNLPPITEKEREIILTIARSFDQMPEVEPPKPHAAPKTSGDLSSFEDYNNRADVPALLERHGWRLVSRRGERMIFKRPGNTGNNFSANFHNRLKIFYVFTTSTGFESGRGYNPVQVYAELEHHGDLSAASRSLYADGYGVRRAKGGSEGKTRIERQPRKQQSSNFYLWFKERQKEREASDDGSPF